MKKIVFILLTLTLMSCKKDAMISYYVKNTSDKAVIFDAIETGPMDSFRTITVEPKDSVEVAQISMKYMTPEKWFNEFNINRKDSVEVNDTKKPQNWIKGIDRDGKLIYTFNIVK
ncbi:hypothetical protein [Flavobacterium bizetiae]|uniref:hypothetical protein n=1 Tax=Flavobacterium bizetiae TaxID=2704140 RepID=UPI003757D18A